MQKLGFQFTAQSGMEQAVSAGLLRGRPFGGVSIAWSHDLDHAVKPISNFRHKRVVAVELMSENKKFLLISVYMPFFDASNRDECLAEASDALSMIEIIIENHPQHLVIIGGDLNTQLKGDSPFDSLWQDVSTRNQLAYCCDLFPSDGYTFRQEKLGQHKFLDHFLVSCQLRKDGLINNCQILDDGHNLSDHLPIMMSLSVSITAEIINSEKIPRVEMLRWNKLSTEVKKLYTERLSAMTDQMAFIRGDLSNNVCRSCHCPDEHCKYFLQQEYDDIISCIKSADEVLPRQKPGIQNDWWTPELSDLKNQSRDIHVIWVSEGKPRSGPTFTERCRVRSRYKCAIRKAQRDDKQEAWDKLHSAMATDDTTYFWKSWRSIYNKNCSQFPPVVDGCSDKKAIAEAFRQSFQSNSEPNNSGKVKNLEDEFVNEYKIFNEIHLSECNCERYDITVESVIEAICSLKSGKCGDDEGINAEHFHNAPYNFILRLSKLFKAMLLHSFVPNQFRLGHMVPIIKETNGSSSDISNYRGITISPIMSKIFDHLLKVMFSEQLTTSHLQFGFKKKNATTHAIFCLKQTVEYYINNGSRVYCTFLDASKAFDRLVHKGLFKKLIEKKLPKIFIDVIISWYDGLQCRVLWDGTYSDWFPVNAGVRQGGVLSPDFYGIYVDELIFILESSGVGCHYVKKFAAALMYADDMAVLAPSLKGLQKLLNLCENYCTNWDIKLNAKKSKNLWFGKGAPPKFCPTINGTPIEWVSKWKYLGVTLVHGPRFGCCIEETLCKYYRALNSILRVDGRSNDVVMLRLIESHCIPILSYAIEVIQVLDRKQKSKMRVAYNSAFRKIFNYSWRESVINLQHELGRSTWEELIEKRTVNFLSKIPLFPSYSLTRIVSN